LDLITNKNSQTCNNTKAYLSGISLDFLIVFFPAKENVIFCRKKCPAAKNVQGRNHPCAERVFTI